MLRAGWEIREEGERDLALGTRDARGGQAVPVSR